MTTEYIYMFSINLWSKQIISLYSISWLVCQTENECVYRAVGVETLNKIRDSFCLQV